MHLSEKGHTYALFAIVVITCALGSLTQTVMNSMLTEVCDDFAIDAAQGQWVTTIYMLTMGVTVPVVTYLARRFSLKRLVYLALGFYLAGSVAGLFAPVFAVLIAARVLQAIATGITLPLVQSVAMTRFPRERTGTAMGIGGIAMGFAPNIGPLIGGALAGSWGWRSFYIILAGLLAVLWVANAVLVKSHGDHDTRPVFDYPSFVQSTLGFGGLLLGASNAATMPLSAPSVWLPALLGAVFIAVFVRRQRVIAHPLICLDIFASRHYRPGFVAQNCLFASFMGITLVLPLFIQGPCHMTALDAGIAFIPATVVALFVNPLAGVLVDKVGARAVCITSSVFLTVGAASFMFVGPGTPLWVLTLLQGVRAELLWVVGLERRPRHGRQRVLRHGPSGVRLAGHGTYDADRHRGGCGRSRRGSGRCRRCCRRRRGEPVRAALPAGFCPLHAVRRRRAGDGPLEDTLSRKRV